MICKGIHGSTSTTSGGPTGTLGVYYASRGFTFPVAFVGDLPVVSPGGKSVSSNDFTWEAIYDIPLAACTVGVFGESASEAAYPGYVAVGRWKA